MTEQAKVLIVDDEPVLRFHLQKILEELWPQSEVVATAGNGKEALELIEAAEPNVVFLDIKMPGMSGIDVAAELVKKKANVFIVFLTAYDEFAVQAFEKGAVDYLLKPVDESRLLKTIARLTEKLNQKPELASVSQLEALLTIPGIDSRASHLTWIKASQGEDIHLVAVQDVVAFVSDDKYTSVFSAGKEYVIRKPIKELEQELNPEQFWRIHRSSIVNVSKIEKVKKEFTGKLSVVMAGLDKDLAVSRSYSSKFKQM